jgi:hypothetical protein
MAKMLHSTPQISQAAWAGDFLDRDCLIPGGARVNPAEFLYQDGVKVTVGANAAQNATSITVAALSGAIPSGTVLYFGTAKFALLTAVAAAAATTLTVQAIPTAITSGNTATYAGSTGRKPIKTGTLLGRTYAERDAKIGFGLADTTNDDEIYLLAFDVTDALFEADCELYRRNCVVKENLLPDWGSYSPTDKAKIRSLYQCVAGLA